MKRILSVLTAILLCVALVPVAAAENRDLQSQAESASQLEALGLFMGRGKNEDNTTDFALNEPLNRAEAVTMLVRALGRGAEAEACEKAHPFTDVPSWADGYISCAYAAELAMGLSDTEFGAADTASGAMYATLLLRALGYSEGVGKDFVWDNPWNLAENCGIVPAGVNREEFLRADAVAMTSAALFAYEKGRTETLADTLIAKGTFTKEQFETAFPGSAPAPTGPDQTETSAEERALYQAELAKLAIDGLWCDFDYTETELCTVVNASYSGGSRGTFYGLHLIYKPSSPLGVKRIDLPLPLRSNSGANAQATNVAITADGKTLTYSFHFDETLINFVTDEVMQEAGTYYYTTDLLTGITTERFAPKD